MSEATLSLPTRGTYDDDMSNAPIPGCPVCDGTGYDPDFNCLCNCMAQVGTSNLSQQLAEANAGPTTYALPSGGNGTGTKAAPEKATDKQRAFARKLADERPEWQDAICPVIAKLGFAAATVERAFDLVCDPSKFVSKREASSVIDCLLAIKPAPKRAPVAVETGIPGQDGTPPLAAGLDLTPLAAFTSRGSVRVAVPGGDTRLKLKVDVVTKGKWAGWVFVKDAAVYGEGKRYGSQKPGGSYQGDVVDALTAILADPKAAILRYSELTGSCGICGTHIEAEESVEVGIGPVCRKKLGM